MRVRYFKLILGLILMVLLSAQRGFTQPSDEVKSLRKEIEELKEGLMPSMHSPLPSFTHLPIHAFTPLRIYA